MSETIPEEVGGTSCHMAVGLRRVKVAVTELPQTKRVGIAGTIHPLASQPRPSGRSPVADEITAERTLSAAPLPTTARFSNSTIEVVFEE